MATKQIFVGCSWQSRYNTFIFIYVCAPFAQSGYHPYFNCSWNQRIIKTCPRLYKNLTASFYLVIIWAARLRFHWICRPPLLTGQLFLPFVSAVRSDKESSFVSRGEGVKLAALAVIHAGLGSHLCLSTRSFKGVPQKPEHQQALDHQP